MVHGQPINVILNGSCSINNVILNVAVRHLSAVFDVYTEVSVSAAW